MKGRQDWGRSAFMEKSCLETVTPRWAGLATESQGPYEKGAFSSSPRVSLSLSVCCVPSPDLH